jgi:hypothetical protein
MKLYERQKGRPSSGSLMPSSHQNSNAGGSCSELSISSSMAVLAAGMLGLPLEIMQVASPCGAHPHHSGRRQGNMSARQSRYFRSPKTTNEKRQSGGFSKKDAETGLIVKGRVRTGKTHSRLADHRDDVESASTFHRSHGKPTHSRARKAKERDRQCVYGAL